VAAAAALAPKSRAVVYVMSGASWESIAIEYAERVEPFTALFGLQMMEEVSLNADDRLLDLGAGSGRAVALPAARLCREVCAVDDAPSMLKLLEQHSQEEGLTNILTIVAHGAELKKDLHWSFDVALSNFGVIFFPDVGEGFRALYQSLRPGGRAMVSAWGTAAETPAFALIPSIARELFGDDRVSSNAGTKRCDGSPEFLTDIMRFAGFEKVEVTGPHSYDVETQTPVDFWDRFALAAPGTMQLLERLGQDDAQTLRTKVLERLNADFGTGPVKLPAAAYFAGGCKPLIQTEQQQQQQQQQQQ